VIHCLGTQDCASILIDSPWEELKELPHLKRTSSWLSWLLRKWYLFLDGVSRLWMHMRHAYEIVKRELLS
jgi:hypothetical protein